MADEKRKMASEELHDQVREVLRPILLSDILGISLDSNNGVRLAVQDLLGEHKVEAEGTTVRFVKLTPDEDGAHLVVGFTF